MDFQKLIKVCCHFFYFIYSVQKYMSVPDGNRLSINAMCYGLCQIKMCAKVRLKAVNALFIDWGLK